MSETHSCSTFSQASCNCFLSPCHKLVCFFYSTFPALWLLFVSDNYAEGIHLASWVSQHPEQRMPTRSCLMHIRIFRTSRFSELWSLFRDTVLNGVFKIVSSSYAYYFEHISVSSWFICTQGLGHLFVSLLSGENLMEA